MCYADGVQVLSRQVRSMIDKARNVSEAFKIVFTPKSSTYQSGVFVDGRWQQQPRLERLEDVTHHFQRQRSTAACRRG